MSSFTRVALSSIRAVRRVWPFEAGRDLGTYAGAFATRIGLLGWEWYEFRPGLWMRLNIRDLVQQTILLEGVWDPILTAFIERTLGPDDVFIDVGAHVGYFTLLASRRVGPGGSVLAIEPNPFALEQLRQNVERNGLQNVLIERAACGDSRYMAKLYLHTESNSSMASLYAGSVAGSTAVEVPCTPLDDLCRDRGVRRVRLVKVDVEGAEPAVLRGMERIMREMGPAIVLELHPELLKDVGTPFESVRALLDDFDYALEPLGGHANYVCRPRATSLRDGLTT
jgi:FkbM family methyltransferase